MRMPLKIFPENLKRLGVTEFEISCRQIAGDSGADVDCMRSFAKNNVSTNNRGIIIPALSIIY